MATILFFVLIVSAVTVHGQSRTLIYDEKKGIIFLDQQDAPVTKNQPKLPPPSLPETDKAGERELIAGREKDPPEAYFEAGLKFFEAGDFHAAQKNFSHANSVNPQPKYMLWLGKCYRQTNQNEEMLKIMRTILQNHPTSDVADDALFEIAFHYQADGDYYMAMREYRRLAEQYPYGESFFGGQSFLRIAREQIRYMRAEMLTYLTELGTRGNNLEEAIVNYQKESDLALTGNPDQATVQSIKERYNILLRERQRQENLQLTAKRYVYYIIAAGLLAVLNIVFMVYMRMSVKEKIAHLDIMEQVVADIAKAGE